MDAHFVWLNHWQQAGPALKAVKAQELARFDYNRNRQLVDAMLQWACDHRRERPVSGLVEQQRIFGLLRDTASRQVPTTRGGR